MQRFSSLRFGLAGLVFSAIALAPHAAAQTASIAVPHLDWKPCHEGSEFGCARAQVPLDYSDPGRRIIELALIKRDATDPARRIGTLFFNPGGPGELGTEKLPQLYPLFPREARERFDIISWDPRGVGESTAVRCFDSAEDANAWKASIPTGFPVGRRERATWVSAWAELSQHCLERDPELPRYVSTADTARDLDLLRQAVGDARLTYLGISYGTFLGATYANLFPHHVRAVVLDGNVDPAAYMNAGADPPPRFGTGLRLGSDLGAAATLDQFIQQCGLVPIERCAFSAGNPSATRRKFDRLMSRLQRQPVGSWTYGKTVEIVIERLYEVILWTDLATILETLWEGRSPEPMSPSPGYPGFEFQYAVVCPESPNPRRPGSYQTQEVFSYARAGDVGLWWTWNYEPCATWTARAANPYAGPWNQPTASPILVINPTFDPATSFQAAEGMVRELADARLLTLEGYGHTALGNPSTCINEHVSRYLIEGILPPVGATCTQDMAPFAP